MNDYKCRVNKDNCSILGYGFYSVTFGVVKWFSFVPIIIR